CARDRFGEAPEIGQGRFPLRGHRLDMAQQRGGCRGESDIASMLLEQGHTELCRQLPDLVRHGRRRIPERVGGRCDGAVALDHAQHGEPTVDHAFLSNGRVSVLAIDNNTPSSPSWNSGHAAERQSAMLTIRELGRGQGNGRRGFSCGLRPREPRRSDETKEVRMPEYPRIRGSRRQLWFGGLVLLVLSAAAIMASPLYPLLQETYGMSETT